MSLLDPDEIDAIFQKIAGCTKNDLQKRIEEAQRPLQKKAFMEQQSLAIEKIRELEREERCRLDVWAGKPNTLRKNRQSRFSRSHEELLLIGRKGPAPRQGNRVTDFTKWIHSLYDERGGTYAAMEKGVNVERELNKIKKPLQHPDWELVLQTPHDESTRRAMAKPIPALQIRGKPMWGLPDLVYRHLPSGQLVIVEIKTSDKDIPLGGWPDLRAQLWCYSQISDPAWESASSIRLVAEVWNKKQGKIYLRRNKGGLMTWMKDDPDFDKSNRELFDLYKKRIEGENEN